MSAISPTEKDLVITFPQLLQFLCDYEKQWKFYLETDLCLCFLSSYVYVVLNGILKYRIQIKCVVVVTNLSFIFLCF